jgi:serine/threonine protein kinase
MKGICALPARPSLWFAPRLIPSAAANRLEGTPAYLPPEILRKQMRVPGFAADAWALGCVAFFCLHGRPRYFGDTDQVARWSNQQLQIPFDCITSMNRGQVLDQIHEEGAKDQRGGEHAVHFAEDKAGSPGSSADAVLRLQDRAADAFIRALHSEGVLSNSFFWLSYLTRILFCRPRDEVDGGAGRGSPIPDSGGAGRGKR